MNPVAQITKWVEEYLSGGLIFVVSVDFLPSKVLQILLDGDEGVKIEDCVQLSKYLGSRIEEENLIDTAYRLEVSSAGIGAPLKLHRQYVKNVGRTIEVKTKEGEKFLGILKEVKEAEVLVEQAPKSKKELAVEKQISFDNISEAKIKITF